jgi:MYXO-CTERM domain-containing protein
MLGFGWVSHAGRGATGSTALVGVIGLALLAVLARRRRARLLLPPPRFSQAAPTAIVCAVAAGTVLVPVVLCNSYNIFNYI